MKYAAAFLSLVLSASAFAQDKDRHVAGKLTASAKPQVVVMTDDQRKAAASNSVALNLDADPNEVICRKESVGSFGSRLKVQRCRTRADRREEAKRELARNGRDADDYKRALSTARSVDQMRNTRMENRNRVGRRGN